MQRAFLSNVLAVLILTAATLSWGTVLPANAAAAKSQAPAMEAVPTANGEAPRTRIRTPPSAPAPTKNIYETLSANKDAGEFIKMVDEADMKGELAGSPGDPDNVITIFVPTNKAMEDISPDVMKRLRISKGTMQSFIEYHVINNTIVTTGTMKGRKSSPASASGETLNFDGTDKKNPPKVNDAVLVGSDISATNGVIHMVSTAVVPPSILSSPKSVPRPAEPPPQPKTAAAVTTTASAAAKLTIPASGFTPPPADTPVDGFAPSATLNATATGATGAAATAASATPAAVTATATPPAAIAPAPAASGDKGVTLFGHKFNW